MKSIFQNEKKCIICGSPYAEEHHIFGGNPNRKNSEKYGLKVYLCPKHHRGDEGAHGNTKNSKDLMNSLHRRGQRRFELEGHSREEFMSLFGRNYLED